MEEVSALIGVVSTLIERVSAPNRVAFAPIKIVSTLIGEVYVPITIYARYYENKDLLFREISR
ncbi:hypothetical protein ACFPN4_11805 [Ureibacillus thermophilus]|uniref:hypothetical protein n=1 Tax=Ureibacillus thermophilus TaxID=367743 RepID=UPI003621226C